MTLITISLVTELRSQDLTTLSCLFHKEKFVRLVGLERDPSTKPIEFKDNCNNVYLRSKVVSFIKG